MKQEFSVKVTSTELPNVSLSIPYRATFNSGVLYRAVMSSDEAQLTDPQHVEILNISYSDLHEVCQFLTRLYENGYTNDYTYTSPIKDFKIMDWERDFCDRNNLNLFNMLEIASNLEITRMVDVLCYTLGNKIKNKTPAELREIFNIKNDFTPEEEDYITKNNQWIDEKIGN